MPELIAEWSDRLHDGAARPAGVLPGDGPRSGDGRRLSSERMPDLTDEELAFLRGILDLAREGRTGELTEAIERGVPVNLTGGSGDSLLILAAYHDHPATVRMLLEHGADPGRVNDRGQTALGAAVFRRSAPSVQALLDHGADPHAGGRSAVEIAAFFELDEMAALLAERSRRPSPEQP